MSALVRPPQRWLVATGGVGAVVALALRSVGMPWADTAALVALLVLLPVASVIQVGTLRGVEVERMGAYVSSGLVLVALGGGTWLVGTRGEGVAAVGLASLPFASFALWTGGLVSGGLGVTVVFRFAGARLGFREASLLRCLLPRTPQERVAFAGLSVAAGFGEEVAYRGYVIPVLSGLLGIPFAAVLSSLVFGILHAYQGPLGVGRTTALGAFLAWGFLASGSLWPPIAAHSILDMLLGMALAEHMMVPERTQL